MTFRATVDEVRSSWTSADRRPLLVFAVAVVSLWLARFGQNLASAEWTRLAELSWWAGTQIVAYLVLPLTVGALIGLRPRDVGWTWRGFGAHWTLYGAIFAVAVPFVIVASFTSAFQDQYPLLEVVPGQSEAFGDLARWWPLYALQFVAIESFFRGFLVLGLAPRLGSMSVLVAVVPYMMIHFVKPPAEALASVIGGLVLGSLALRTRSIMGGIGVHLGVAALMDVLALGHKGFL